MDARKRKNFVIAAIIALALLGGYWYLRSAENQSGKLDGFAECLKAKEAVFYGTFWCPHCRNEKALFGNSARLLPYVECSTPDGNGQLPICRDKGIKGYPTWEFKDGSRLEGEVPLETLALKTGCLLPK